MISVYDNYLMAELILLKSQTELMRLLSTSDGFFHLYQSKVSETANAENAFKQLNVQYKMLFGCYKFENYGAFAQWYVAKGMLTTGGTGLKDWFCDKGFNTMQSFMPLVLHYYPEVGRFQIVLFWNDKPVKAQTLKLINYVKQIIG